MPSKADVRVSLPLRQQLTLINAFGQRDLKSKFKGTMLGWVWSFVVPLATLGIYTLIFGGLFKMQPPGIAARHEGIAIFAVWLFAGLIIWGFFQNSINAGINGLLSTGGLLQKVYFPAYAPVLGTGLAVAVQSTSEVLLLLLVFILLGNVSWTWLLLLPFFALLVVFVQAVTVILAIWNVYVRDLAQLTGVILQLMFYATPIIYTIAIVPENLHGVPVQAIVAHMPVAEFITVFRALIYDLTSASAMSWGLCFMWALLALVGARLVYKRHGVDLSERI